jgi:hypothetical protein
MQLYITVDDLKTLSPQAQQRLSEWYVDSDEWDDDPVYCYIPEEAVNGHDGIFKGTWESECEFQHPEDYLGKLKNYEGMILPILSIQQMLELLDANDNADLALQLYLLIHVAELEAPFNTWSFNSALLCQRLWEGVKRILER